MLRHLEPCVSIWNIAIMVKVTQQSEFKLSTRNTLLLGFQKEKKLIITISSEIIRLCVICRDMSTKNLVYLSSSQALADIANFINKMNSQYKLPKDVKWVAFGGSYPGSLAAWVRVKFPHLVYAAVSTSGPLLAKVNFMGNQRLIFNI